jgi:hypothetical protein
LSGDVPADDLAVLAKGPYQAAPEFSAESLTAKARQWVARYG